MTNDKRTSLLHCGVDCHNKKCALRLRDIVSVSCGQFYKQFTTVIYTIIIAVTEDTTCIILQASLLTAVARKVTENCMHVSLFLRIIVYNCSKMSYCSLHGC
jgi:hypothetical protein